MKKIVIKSLLLSMVCVGALQFTSCKKDKPTVQVETPAAETPAPVEITADQELSNTVVAATKDFPGVTATVANGEITLTGIITRERLPMLMQSLNALHPKKINNNLTINK